MAVVRYEILVSGVLGMKSVFTSTNLDDAVDFYDDLCKLINTYVSNYKGSIFRGVLFKDRDKSKVIKARYYLNNNGKLSYKEVK